MCGDDHPERNVQRHGDNKVPALVLYSEQGNEE